MSPRPACCITSSPRNNSSTPCSTPATPTTTPTRTVRPAISRPDRRVAERFDRAPELIGTFTVLLVENILPDAPLHDRLLTRYQDAVDIVAEHHQRGQSDGRYRTDVDAAAKAVEIIAFVTGMETTWLLDPSIPLTDVFKEYADSLGRELRRNADMRYRLDVVAPTASPMW